METLQRKELFSSDPQVSKETWEEAFRFAIHKVEENLLTFTDGYPAPASINNVYPKIANVEWTSSFYNGMLWLSYLHTKDVKFKLAAEATLSDYANRIDNQINTNTHDLGFLYILSCKAQYLVTGNEEAKKTALKAADLLMVRYSKTAHIIQAWGDLDDPNQKGRIIIDCLMNVPLLFWATEVTGNESYRTAAVNHINATRENIIREDDTTYHTFYFDTVTGKPLRGVTNQGYSDNSCWSRGQAWGIYGLALAYSYTQDTGCLTDAKRLANHFLNNLGNDLICYWDLIFTQGKEERDSSAAAIAACGLLLLAKHLDDGDAYKAIYHSAALHIMKSLSENYTSISDANSNGILLHAVYGKPHNSGVDECNIWGDYFYMEALSQMLDSTPLFW
jgi:unsaturated chondroitin disaccharide hydrolase